MELYQLFLASDFVDQGSIDRFEAGKKTKQMLLFLAVKETTALFMKVAVIGPAVGGFDVRDMTPLCDVTHPLVCSAHHMDTSYNVVSKL